MTVQLAGVFAHPDDDDSYVLGGTLLLHPGTVEPTLVFATSGEAGPINEGTGVTRERLGRAREAEQAAFLEAVGYGGAATRFLRHPDYRLPQVPFERLVGEVEAVLRQVRPQVVVSFGPDGLTSHHDHIRAGEAAAEAFSRARAADGRAGGPGGAFQRLYQAAYPRSDVDRFYAGVRDGRFDYGEEATCSTSPGSPTTGSPSGSTPGRWPPASGTPSSATASSWTSTSGSRRCCAGSCSRPSASCRPGPSGPGRAGRRRPARRAGVS